MIAISLNGEPCTVTDDLPLKKALQTWGYRDDQNFAVAVNGEFVPHSEYLKTRLKNKDQVDVVTMVQGG
jgi:thiamine biosynthesis protein ThiS